MNASRERRKPIGRPAVIGLARTGIEEHRRTPEHARCPLGKVLARARAERRGSRHRKPEAPQEEELRFRLRSIDRWEVDRRRVDPVRTASSGMFNAQAAPEIARPMAVKASTSPATSASGP